MSDILRNTIGMRAIDAIRQMGTVRDEALGPCAGDRPCQISVLTAVFLLGMELALVCPEVAKLGRDEITEALRGGTRDENNQNVRIMLRGWGCSHQHDPAGNDDGVAE